MMERAVEGRSGGRVRREMRGVAGGRGGVAAVLVVVPSTVVWGVAAVSSKKLKENPLMCCCWVVKAVLELVWVVPVLCCG